MKLNFSNLKMVGTDRRAVRADVLRPDAATQRPYPQQGVALIITLILLAVVTVMAVAFLATSRRERGAVTTTTDTAGARLAADAALAQAEAQIMANVLATTNPYNFGLVVSTNYINSYGFVNNDTDPTNVNYDYLSTGGALNQSEQQQNIANLQYSPRVPVFVPSPPDNYSSPTNYDFRFFLNLNRNVDVNGNALFDANGVVTNFDSAGNNIGTISEVGDPEWIGILDHPDQPHGPNNRFIARYAFIAVPIGNALDLNAIHNQVLNNNNPLSGNDGFFRNEGVGSWEINLAAFLADLNTNQWGQNIGNATWYQYNQANAAPFANSGNAFDDARALLAYRYNDNYDSLYSFQRLYGANGYSAYFNGDIDTYTLGNLMTNTYLPGVNVFPKQTPWAGSDNTNHFFDMQELFNPNESSADFTNRLLSAGIVTPTHQSTYDRYTFYRLLSQLGTDSTPEQNKMNLNYDNLDPYIYTVAGITYTNPPSETNFMAWTALGFFTNAADRMLRAYSQEWLTRDPTNYVATYNLTNAFGITDIPVLVSNQFVYSSAIQRVLQLAANIYDATTNNSIGGSPDWPDVFRPIFEHDNLGNVFIVGYTNLSSSSGLNTVTGAGDPQLALPYDVENLTNLLADNTPITDANGYVNVYGVPWIIGAKKGFPNFNEFSMECPVQLTRRLQFIRTTNSAGIPTFTATNQMYDMSISNELGVECWNSYSNNYVPFSGNVSVVVRDNLSMTLALTNNALNISSNYFISTNISMSVWPGWVNNIANTNAFVVAMDTNINFLPDSVYRFATERFVSVAPNPLFETGIYPITILPDFTLQTTNKMQAFILDGTNVIDYVQFGGPSSQRDLNAEIFTDGNYTNAGVWDATLSSLGLPNGVLNQIQISKGSNKFTNGPPTIDGIWHRDLQAIPLGGTVPQQQASFASFFMPAGNPTTVIGWGGDPTAISSNNPALSVEAPYEPTRYAVEYVTWQANDPLIHYIANDLNFALNTTTTPKPGITNYNYGTTLSTLTKLNLGQLNDHYSPWGGNPVNDAQGKTQLADASTVTNIAVKDPLAYFSDNWDFPKYKLPTVGWLGRVHRGTPWQTIDLKSVLPDIFTWTNWTGDLNPFDADNSSPGEDRLLFDFFTTAPNDNATRGQLSVNVGANDTNNLQTGLAAWSALFSGVVVPTNTIGGYTVVQPAGAAGASSFLEQLVANINQTRANTNLFPLGAFEHVGDILATPQLSIFTNVSGLQSPFLNTNTIYNDEMYEWLPQQVMSLLRVSGTPQSPMRYVIYCYGQTLKPALNGIVTSGSLFGICTNYQVVAEAATRAVVQFGSTRTNIFMGLDNSPAVITTNVNNNAVIENFNVLPPD